MYNKTLMITNHVLCQKPLLEQIHTMCSYHPKGIILREKDLSYTDYKTLAQSALDICNQYHVPLILHNFIGVAIELHHDMIHLPLSILRENRSNLSSFSTIGTSIHSVEDAIEAVSLGATYLTAGHIYSTDCKKDIPPRGIQFLQDVCSCINLPVYAIGGIHYNKEQFEEIESAGAKGACIMSDSMRLQTLT